MMHLPRSRSAPALLCVGLLAFALLLVWPVAETGVLDDWSYIFSVQQLARTGHIQYNGWATAMLGWPLYVGAAAVRLFGFSFTVVRLTTMVEALVCTFLLQRTFRLAGIAAWNGVLGTLTVVLCPLFLFSATSFMSDLPGLLAVVFCLYACLRALRSEGVAGSRAWIATAALSNAVLGTSRQIAWLGVLLMVPAAIILLRKRRSIVPDAIVTLLAILLVFGMLRWYNRQIFAVPEHLLQGPLGFGAIGRLGQVGLALLIDLGMFLLPVLVGLRPSFRRLKGMRLYVWLALAAGLLLFCLRLTLHHHAHNYLAPALLYGKAANSSEENLFASITAPAKGSALLPPEVWMQSVLSLLSLGGVLAALALALQPLRAASLRVADESGAPDWYTLSALTVPYLCAYCLLLAPRALFGVLFDRYILLLLPCALLLLLRLYQAHFGSRPALLSFALVAVAGGLSICSTHDFYATYRASIMAAQEVQRTGVPRTAIDAGWEYNHYTELLVSGHVWQDGMRLPNGAIYRVTEPYPLTPPCSLEAQPQTPHVFPRYALAYPTSNCRTAQQFPAVHFRAWLPPLHRTIRVVFADDQPAGGR